MTQLEILIAACFLLQAPTNCKDPSIQRLVRDAPVVVVAEIEEVKPPLGVWSGLFLVVQRVNYKVKDVLKGETKQDRISVGHYIVARSSTADDQEPRLSPKLFVKGKMIVLFLTDDPGKGYLSPPEESNGKAYQYYLALDSRCGLVPADAATLIDIKQYTSQLRR